MIVPMMMMMLLFLDTPFLSLYLTGMLRWDVVHGPVGRWVEFATTTIKNGPDGSKTRSQWAWRYLALLVSVVAGTGNSISFVLGAATFSALCLFFVIFLLNGGVRFVRCLSLEKYEDRN